MKIFTIISTGILSTVFLLSSLAIADDDTGFYLGVGLNRLSADFEDENDVDFEESDNAGIIKLGYMFNDFVGVEVGYIDLGDYDAEGNMPSNRIDLDAEAFTLAIVGNWSVIDKMDLYAKAGIYSIDVESNSVVADNLSLIHI